MSREYPYDVWIFYASDVKFPKRAGAQAMHTEHKTLGNAQTEIGASKRRADIGYIEAVGPDLSTSIRRDQSGEWVSK